MNGMFLSHPEASLPHPQSMGKLSSTKLVPGAFNAIQDYLNTSFPSFKFARYRAGCWEEIGDVKRSVYGCTEARKREFGNWKQFGVTETGRPHGRGQQKNLENRCSPRSKTSVPLPTQQSPPPEVTRKTNRTEH